MIKMPIEQIIARIKEEKGITEAEVNEKIEQKLSQLSGLISKEGAAHIIANELGVKLFETSGKLQVKNICAGMRNVDVTGEVMDVYEVREFEGQRGKGKVGSILLADETGSIRVVFWNDQADKIQYMKKGDTIKLQSGYVRENNNRVEVQLNDRSRVIVNPPGEKVIGVRTTREPAGRKTIKELSEQDQNVEILGTIVQVFDPRFFEVCPTCSKRARPKDDGFYCESHGKVEPAFSYVMNAFLDDGTENIRAVFFRNQAERLVGLQESEFLKFKDNISEFENVKTEILGNIVKLFGRVTKNQMFDRLEFMVNRVETDVDPKEELRMMQQNQVEKPAVVAPKIDVKQAVQTDVTLTEKISVEEAVPDVESASTFDQTDEELEGDPQEPNPTLE